MTDKDLIIKLLQEEKLLWQKEKLLLQKEVQSLQSKIAELQRRLGLNSTNSSKPPSSDGFKKHPPQSLRKKGEKKSGGQLGHKGDTLKQVSVPDYIERYSLDTCPGCQSDLKLSQVESVQKRQVFDIPEPKIEVTEHQAEVKMCGCGKRSVAAFPPEITAPVQYGIRAKTLAVYFNSAQLIPEDRVTQVFGDIFSLNIASATIVKFGASLATTLTPWKQDVEAQLAASHVKHLDETGLRIEKKTQWLHVMSNEYATIYRVSIKRGEMFQNLAGTIVHDCFTSYYALVGLLHGLCNAHILRELKAISQFEKEAWAGRMAVLLCFANKNRDKEEQVNRIYDDIVAKGLTYHESLEPLKQGKRGRKKRRVGHNLLIRLRDRKDDILRFLSDPMVAFTNNLAEQDLRMMKVKMKISGGFRSSKGAENFATIRSFISTCRKQNINIFQAIHQAQRGVLPKIAIPPYKTKEEPIKSAA